MILTLFGGGVHYAQGLCFALIYAFGIHPLMPIANTVLGNFAKAIIWGLILGHDERGVVDQPLPEPRRPGQERRHLHDQSGPTSQWLVAVYLWHIVYGFTLGAFYQPLPKPASEVVEVEVTPSPA